MSSARYERAQEVAATAARLGADRCGEGCRVGGGYGGGDVDGDEASVPTWLVGARLPGRFPLRVRNPVGSVAGTHGLGVLGGDALKHRLPKSSTTVHSAHQRTELPQSPHQRCC